MNVSCKSFRFVPPVVEYDIILPVTRRKKVLIALLIFTGIVLLSMLVPVIQYALDNAGGPLENLGAFTPDATRTRRPSTTPRDYPLPVIDTPNPYPRPLLPTSTPYP